MAKCGYAIIATTMVIVLLIGCGPAAPTGTPVPPTDTPALPTRTPVLPTGTPAPTKAALPTAKQTPAPTSLPSGSPGGSIALTSDRGDKTVADFRAYGDRQNDSAYDVLLLADGGTLIAGLANNTEPSHRITPGNARLIRTDPEGNILWEKDYGGEDDALFNSLIPVGDDAYVVLGEIAASYERDETDFYLVKVDGEGNEIWSHTYGGRGMDHGKIVRQTADGGFILTGNRADEFPTGNVYEGNIVLIKTDAEGNEVWTRTYGEKILYLAWGVAQTPDGGYVLTGWEAKTIDDRDVIVLKTDEAGEVEWSHSWDLGPGDRDGGFDMILTSDGYIVVACIQSMGSGAPSAVLLKLDLEGNEIWNKLVGEQGVGNTFWHIAEDADGGYVMAGDTHLGRASASGAVIHGGLIVKTDPDGNVLWQYVVGGGEYEQVILGAAVVLPAGGYLLVGSVTRGGAPYSDMLWLQLTPALLASSPAAASTWFKTYGGPREDVGWGVLLTDDGGYYIVGTTGLEFEPQMRGNVYLVRTDAAGEVLWEKIYERDGYAEGLAIAWAGDGNLLLSGPAALPGTSGMAIYLLKVDPAGNELWFKTFDGPLDEMGSAWPLEDGGYLLAGNAVDPDDIVADPGAPGYAGMAGRSNVYLARTDADGNELWSRTYGGANNVMVCDGLQTTDGGLLLLATIMYYPQNDDDIYLLRVDADGNEVWSQTWEEGMASAGGLVLTGDGNYLIAGSYSPPEVMDREKRDFLFIQVDPQGNEIWRSVWGDPDAGDDAALLAGTADGGSIAAGDTGGDLSSWNQDIALLKLDAQGQLLWRQVIATQSHQMYGQIVQHPDGGYVLVGSLVRNGQFDVFLIKTDAQGQVEQP